MTEPARLLKVRDASGSVNGRRNDARDQLRLRLEGNLSAQGANLRSLILFEAAISKVAGVMNFRYVIQNLPFYGLNIQTYSLP